MSEPAGATPFSDTARGSLAPTAEFTEPVTFYTNDGSSYTTSNPVEITRLRYSRSHYLSQADAEDPAAADDTKFHPDDHRVDEVLSYTEENPADAERVVAEEKAGKARKGVVGDKE